MIVHINLNSYVTPPNTFIEKKVVNSDAELHRLLKALDDLFDSSGMQGNLIRKIATLIIVSVSDSVLLI